MYHDPRRPLFAYVSETTVNVRGRPVVIPDHTYLRGPGPRVVVRFPGPIGSTWANRLTKLGATVEFWCPPYGACVTMTGDAAEKLATSEIIAGYVPYDEKACDVRAVADAAISRPVVGARVGDVRRLVVRDVAGDDLGCRQLLGRVAGHGHARAVRRAPELDGRA